MIAASTSHAGYLEDLLRQQLGEQKTKDVSQQDMVAAVREALIQGNRTAVRVLGTRDGFYGNKRLRIPVPKHLTRIEQGLRQLGQGKTADEFILSLNRAAEHAVPLTRDVLVGAIRKMTVQDVLKIVRGPDDAATQYFRGKTEADLVKQLLPIVQSSTNKVGVTRSYKRLVKQAGPLAAFIDVKPLDLDRYVTRKCLDGLFATIADEEKRIRKHPVARTTELLKRVFGGSI